MKISGAKIVIEVLKKHNIDTVFGYPGGSIINVYDELFRARKDIKHYLTASEQGACHSADGYARASGKVGVVLATSGPGATNLITAIATAYLDSSPLVIFTGNISRADIGKDAFQEVDIQGISMPITKHNYIVTEIDRLEDIIIEAFFIAASGRPGPVLIDLPKDIQEKKTFYKNLLPKSIKKSFATDISKSTELILSCKRPIIVAGGGVVLSNASEELAIFCNKINSPVVSTMMGMSAYNNYDSRFVGMLGLYNSNNSQKLLDSCDLVIAIGMRFSNKTVPDKSILIGKKILHIDIDPSEIDKNIEAEVSLIGDVKFILNRLNTSINTEKAPWFINTKANYCDDHTLSPKTLINKINQLLPPDSIIVTDVGQHQLWVTQNFKFKYPRSFITSGGLGAMGFGMGGAIGSVLATQKTVVLFTGDGSFLMNLNELATLSNYKIKVIIIILNNKSLGLVRQWQKTYFNHRYAYTELKNKFDFVKIAKGFKCCGYRINTYDDIQPVIEKALSCKKSVVVDVKIDIEECINIGNDIEKDSVDGIILRG